MSKFFNFKHFKGDFFGGITAGIVALPLALAFGLQSGMGVEAGLYGAIFIGFFAALFGGTSTQISGPTAPMTAVSMIVIANILADNEGDMTQAIPSILIIFLFAGIIQVILGISRMGRYVEYVPYPVISGFMTGIGVIILITQILPVLGYYPKEDSEYVNQFKPHAEELILDHILREEAAEEILVLEDFKETVKRAEEITEDEIMKEAKVLAVNNASGVLGSLKMLPRALKNIQWSNFLLCMLTIFIIYGFKRITKVVPSTLVALLVVSGVTLWFMDDYRSIGDVPSGFPILHLEMFTSFNFVGIKPYLYSAISLALLGAIDSLLTSIIADNMTKDKHNPNKELVGQGIGNSIAALFGGIPGAGATIRTVVNIQSGGRTNLSGMIAGLLLLSILLALGPYASKIPAAVLAGILVSVGISVMDYKGIRHIRRLPFTEIIIMLVVLALTVFVGLIEAVIVGLIMASVIFMKKISDIIINRATAKPLKKSVGELPQEYQEIANQPQNDYIYVKELEGPLFFGFSSRFQEMIKKIPKAKTIIIRMDKVPYIDQSGLYAIEETIKNLQHQNISVILVGLYGQPLNMFEQFRIIPQLIESENSFSNILACIKQLNVSSHAS